MGFINRLYSWAANAPADLSCWALLPPNGFLSRLFVMENYFSVSKTQAAWETASEPRHVLYCRCPPNFQKRGRTRGGCGKEPSGESGPPSILSPSGSHLVTRQPFSPQRPQPAVPRGDRAAPLSRLDGPRGLLQERRPRSEQPFPPAPRTNKRPEGLPRLRATPVRSCLGRAQGCFFAGAPDPSAARAGSRPSRSERGVTATRRGQ